MIVVADSGPLHYLVLLDQAELLKPIALAHHLGADLLLIDEISGRAEARRRSLRVTGTLGILRIAAEQELIDVPEVLARLRGTSFYVAEDLIRAIFGQWLVEGAE